MSKICVRNFGPIKDGYNEDHGWMDVKKVTVFIGNQGSGKSTIAKLISTLTWIEKALTRGDLKEKEVTRKNKFENICAYHNIKNYFDKNGNTQIFYSGDSYNLIYRNNVLNIEKVRRINYTLPKIMYVPSERNFLSAVKFRNLQKIKELPRSLFTFNEEMERSQKELLDDIQLPIGKTKFEFDKLNDTGNLIGEDYKLKLSETSSGFQSLIPLFLVSHNLANSIRKEKDPTVNEMSSEIEKKFQTELEDILEDETLPEEVKKGLLKALPQKYRNGCFINIVEEPEQNLFPDSQRQILTSLLSYNNMDEGNKLIMTTHSPYMINYLSIAIQADYLKEKIKSEESMQKLNSIIPIDSTIKGSNVVVYQLDEENGKVIKLPNFEGIPSDKNYLNMILRKGNQLFDSLLEIEEEL